MSLTVRQLIAQLKKMPPGAKVCVVAHDQNPEAGEFDGAVRRVEEAPMAIRDRGYAVMLAQ